MSKFVSAENLGIQKLKIVELGKILKTENLTKIVSEFCVGQALMPIQP